MNDIIKNTQRLAALIENNKNQLMDILTTYESYETALDEITRSLDCLQNINIEIPYLCFKKIDSMSVFFPLNLPLYSLVLFAIIPSFTSRKIFARPPNLMQEVLKKICITLNIEENFPSLKFVYMDRRLFLEGYVSTSDVVLFIGKYNNALSVKEHANSALFIYNGAGINPFLISAQANIKLAAEKVIEARVFNSGQDCAGPDAIIVHTKVADIFIEELIRQVSIIKVGSYKDQDVRIGKLISNDQLNPVGNFFKDYEKEIVYGGLIDFKNSIVYPTIIKTKLSNIVNYSEFFSPVFFISTYAKNEELDLFFQTQHYSEFAMYVSIFGKCDYSRYLKNSTLLYDKNILDIERGNKAYGGVDQGQILFLTMEHLFIDPS